MPSIILSELCIHSDFVSRLYAKMIVHVSEKGIIGKSKDPCCITACLG